MEMLWRIEFMLAEARRATRLATRCVESMIGQAAPSFGRLWSGLEAASGGEEDDGDFDEEEDFIYPSRRRRRRRPRRRPRAR